MIPRSRSSGALSIYPYSRTAIYLFFVCSTFVIAAVNVVFPWSMCPIVPTFTCGFVRSYFALAIRAYLRSRFTRTCSGFTRDRAIVDSTRLFEMEPMSGIEPETSPLPRACSAN